MSELNQIKPAKTGASADTGVKKVNRRQMLGILGITLNAIAGVLFATPIIGYMLGPATRRQLKKEIQWVNLGALEQFPVGQTRLATYRNPFVHQWDGSTGDVPCWVRRIATDKFQVFAINCAHLGCPVRWFRNQDCSCVRVTVVFIMRTAPAPRARPPAASSNMTTRWRTASFGLRRARCPRSQRHPVPARRAPS